MIRTYIDWLLDVPWCDDDRRSARSGRGAARARRGSLRPRQGQGAHRRVPRGPQARKGDMKGPILCFVGPPGVGKTSLGQSIARAMNRKFVRISLGGVRDEAEIRGHRRTYIGSIPGRIVQALKQAGATNPVFMLDEIDKVARRLPGRSGGGAARGARSGAEPLVPRPLPRDRRSISRACCSSRRRTSSARSIRRCSIAWRSSRWPATPRRRSCTSRGATCIPRQLDETRPAAGRAGHHRRRPARGHLATTRAKRACATSSGRSARSRARSPRAWRAGRRRRTAPTTVVTADESDRLSRPGAVRIASCRSGRRGPASRPAWRGPKPAATCSSSKPACCRAATSNIILTGQLGNVMQESARAARQPHPSRTRGARHPRRTSSTKHDLHVHVPAGAIPKDGPSAGVTMATAIVSAVRHEPVREDVAMTGEITLSGLVLPVGGIREKALAARRLGDQDVRPAGAERARSRRARPKVAPRHDASCRRRRSEDVLNVALPARTPRTATAQEA